MAIHHHMEFILFGEMYYNIQNPPNRKTVLALDHLLRSLYIYRNGTGYSLSKEICDKFIDKDTGKLMLSLIPALMASKVWVTTLITNKISSIFKFKGILLSYNDLLNITDALQGDVYVCRDTNDLYVYILSGTYIDPVTSQELSAYYWLPLGGTAAIGAQQLTLIDLALQMLGNQFNLVSAAVLDTNSIISGQTYINSERYNEFKTHVLEYLNNKQLEEIRINSKFTEMSKEISGLYGVIETISAAVLSTGVLDLTEIITEFHQLSSYVQSVSAAIESMNISLLSQINLKIDYMQSDISGLYLLYNGILIPDTAQILEKINQITSSVFDLSSYVIGLPSGNILPSKDYDEEIHQINDSLSGIISQIQIILSKTNENTSGILTNANNITLKYNMLLTLIDNIHASITGNYVNLTVFNGAINIITDNISSIYSNLEELSGTISSFILNNIALIVKALAQTYINQAVSSQITDIVLLNTSAVISSMMSLNYISQMVSSQIELQYSDFGRLPVEIKNLTLSLTN